MPKKELPPLSDVQHEVMSVVWELKKCSAAEVWNVLKQQRNVSRNTVHTLVVRLEEKGWLKRCDNKSGPGNRSGVLFAPTVSKTSTQKRCVKRLVDTVFGGSAEGLVLTLLNQKSVTEEEAKRIRSLIDQSTGDRS